RIPQLLVTPAAVRFVSYEPALAAVDFRTLLLYDGSRYWNALTGQLTIRIPADDDTEVDWVDVPAAAARPLDWIIVGGESGRRARPCNVAWVRSAVEQCQAAGVAVFVKQLGSQPCNEGRPLLLKLRDRKGGDPDEWPEDLRVRQWPPKE